MRLGGDSPVLKAYHLADRQTVNKSISDYKSARDRQTWFEVSHRGAVTNTVCPSKPNIFIIWPFTEKVWSVFLKEVAS